MTDIRWGILGCGDVCEVKSGPAFNKVAGSRLVAVMRRDGGKAADYARRHGVPRSYDDAAKLIADDEVNAVYIATPPGNHCELALAVAEAGKACYVEKPMARTAAECLRMCEAFERRGLPLFVAYYRRRLPGFVAAKRAIDAGRLGTITHVDYRMTRLHRPDPDGQWRMDLATAGAGLVLDLGSHTMDAIDSMLGPVENVHGVAFNHSANGVEDACCMSFSIGKAIGTASWNFAGCVKEDVITITGTAGRIVMPTFGQEPVRLVTADGEETFDATYPKHVQQPLIETVVGELLGRDGVTCPSTGRSALRTNRVLDEMLVGFYGDRSRLFA